MKTATDEDVLSLAAHEQRVMLTFDLDVGHILAASHEHAPSVILQEARPELFSACFAPSGD